jgi:formate dehydrogenase major subunit
VATPEPSVLIARAPCVLNECLTFGPPVALDPDKCTDCHACVQLGCPALELHGLALRIDPLRCVGCAHCQQVCADCNTGLDVNRVLDLLEHDQIAEAVDVVLRANPLPATVARICPHPCDHSVNALGWPQAERRAQRYPRLVERFGNAEGRAVSVRAVEQWLGDYALEHPRNAFSVAEHRVSVAIVGSGPAGLSAAWQLRRRGCRVTVVESDAELGGMLRHGIPEFRLPRAVLDAELARLMHAGIRFQTSTRLNNRADFELLRARHDAVVIAVGHSRARALRLMDADRVAAGRVITGLDFLSRFNAGQRVPVGGSVAIIGGGNTAIDCARAAVRLGARAVVVYRRTEKEMPAIPEEVAAARREGVVFEFEKIPIRVITGATGELIALETRQAHQDSGRVLEIAGTESSTHFDTVITAVGEEADVGFLAGTDVQTNDGIVTGFAGTTAAAGVFAGGDAGFGYGTVGQAIASGRKTADAVWQFLASLRS